MVVPGEIGQINELTKYNPIKTLTRLDYITYITTDEPTALENFNKLAQGEQKKIVDWIFSVKNDDLRVERIGQSIEKLLL